MLLTAKEKLINDLAAMEQSDFDNLMEEVEAERERREKEKFLNLFTTFEKIREELEELGYYPYLYTIDKDIPIDILVWKEVK